MADRSGKTEKPTAKRKRDARRDGQIARSTDLVSWLSLLLATFLVSWVTDRTGALVESSFASVRDVIADPQPQRALEELSAAMRGLAVAIAPLLGVLAVLAIVANLTQTGLLVTTKLLAPKLERVNPMKGLKRLFSTRSLWEVGKQIIKSLIICAVAWPVVRGLVEELVAAGHIELAAALPRIGDAALQLLRRVAAAGLLVALVDYAYQRRRLMKDLMMSVQEVKEEAKNAEGNPEIKGRIRAMQTRMARNRMIAAVGKADVVVVNPTHVAVALSYRSGLGAPKVLAKGADLIAARIRQEARTRGVPVVEAPPLARAIYGACRVDDEIPEALYEAVAKLLVFVHRLRVRTALAGHHVLPPAFRTAV